MSELEQIEKIKLEDIVIITTPVKAVARFESDKIHFEVGEFIFQVYYPPLKIEPHLTDINYIIQIRGAVTGFINDVVGVLKQSTITPHHEQTIKSLVLSKYFIDTLAIINIGDYMRLQHLVKERKLIEKEFYEALELEL